MVPRYHLTPYLKRFLALWGQGTGEIIIYYDLLIRWHRLQVKLVISRVFLHAGQTKRPFKITEPCCAVSKSSSISILFAEYSMVSYKSVTIWKLTCSLFEIEVILVSVS